MSIPALHLYGGDESLRNLELLHAHCRRQLHPRGVEDDDAASCEGRS
jgi:hypothetical protein